jgi:signal transduction histidine kinase
MKRQLYRTRRLLTLGATGVFAVAAAAASFALWISFSHFEYAAVDSTLANQAQLVLSGLQDSNGQITFSGSDSAPAETANGIAVGVLLFDSRGNVVARVGTAPSVSSLASTVKTVARSRQPLTTTTGLGLSIQRVLVEPVPAGAGFNGVLALSRPLSELNETLRLFGISLASVALALTMLAGALTYLLAGRALRPVEAMTGTLQRFTADAAHELRAPLAIMRTELEVSLSKPRGAEEYRQTQRVVLDEVLRLGSLADELLTLAQADAGALQPRLEDVDLADFAEETAARWHPLARDAQVRLETHAATDVTVPADRLLLRRLLDNLLDNAIRHTPPGGSISVSVGRDGDACTVVVADTGPGVAPDQRNRLFGRFTRSDAARGRDTGGAGLGLALCRVIAELHGGRIALEDTQQGAAFRVTLPVTAGQHGHAIASQRSGWRGLGRYA